MIFADFEAGSGAFDGEHFDIAAVERGVDLNLGHLTSIVAPEVPGKPWNNASLILGAPSDVVASGDLLETVKLARPSHSVAALARSLIATAKSVAICAAGLGDRLSPIPSPTPDP